VNQQTQILFESIESAKEYLLLLSEAVREAHETFAADASGIHQFAAGRQAEAARLVAYNLSKLERHLQASQRILNDLRSLRRLLLQERMGAGVFVASAASSQATLRGYKPNAA
jgi:hypothetical protein